MTTRDFAKKSGLLIVLLLMTTITINAQQLSDLSLMANDGTFLGTFENEYALNSIFNDNGRYGSKYSITSIFNRNAQYGSEYSLYSPFNPYATKPPIIVDKQGNTYGKLSLNRYAQGVTNESYQLALKLKTRWNALNK